MSNCIELIKSRSFKNFLYFSIPIAWPILTEPMLPERINISSAVKFEGIFLSYSLILFFPQVIFFSKFLNSVFGSITFSFKAAAKVKVLKTEPNS